MGNVGKNKVIRSVSDGIVGEINIVIDGQVLHEVEVIKYIVKNAL